MLITHASLVFYTPGHTPNYPANDSVWKAQNKCIPARKVKKLQMNQNSNSQGNLVVLLRYFFPKKIECLSSEDSTFTQEDIQAVWSHHPGILCTVLRHQHPPPPPTRTVSLYWFATRTPTVFLHPNAERPFTDSSPFLLSYFFGMVDQFHRHRWKYPLKVTRPSFFFWGGGYHPTLKLSGITTFTFIVSITHRMDNI